MYTEMKMIRKPTTSRSSHLERKKGSGCILLEMSEGHLDQAQEARQAVSCEAFLPCLEYFSIKDRCQVIMLQ